MSVRIYNDGLAGAAASEAKRAEELSRTSGAGQTRAPGSLGSGEDQVSISSLSENLTTTNGVLDAQRVNRVQHLAALYQSGNYKVDAQQVSRAIVDDALRSGPAGKGE